MAKDFIINLGIREKNSRLKAGTALHHPFITGVVDAFDDSFLTSYMKKNRSQLPLRDREVDLTRICLRALV